MSVRSRVRIAGTIPAGAKDGQIYERGPVASRGSRRNATIPVDVRAHGNGIVTPRGSIESSASSGAIEVVIAGARSGLPKKLSLTVESEGDALATADFARLRRMRAATKMVNGLAQDDVQARTVPVRG